MTSIVLSAAPSRRNLTVGSAARQGASRGPKIRVRMRLKCNRPASDVLTARARATTRKQWESKGSALGDESLDLIPLPIHSFASGRLVALNFAEVKGARTELWKTRKSYKESRYARTGLRYSIKSAERQNLATGKSKMSSWNSSLDARRKNWDFVEGDTHRLRLVLGGGTTLFF